MDLYKIIEDLHRERQKLDHAIRFLEELQQREEADERAHPGRRRKMSSEARHAAAERMRKYWADRKARATATGTG